MFYKRVKNPQTAKPRRSSRLNTLIFKYYNVQYFGYGIHNLQHHQEVTIINKVKPAKGNIVTENNKNATIVRFSDQRIHLKTENGFFTTREYKNVKAR